MKKIKIISAACAVLLCSNVFFTEFVSAESSDKTVKILSVGDSITDGYGVEGSYRKFLYKELTDDGYTIDMTGPNWSWGDAEYSDPDTGETFAYDAAHCGYSGYAIEEYSGRNGIYETIAAGNYLEVYNPDIVILQIGTNDIIDNHEIDSAGDRLEKLVTYILDNIDENSALFVTTVPYLEPNRSDVYSWFLNYRHSADWSSSYSDEEAAEMVDKQTDNYNSQVKTIIGRMQKEGRSNLFLGDINSVITDVGAQLGDGVHPNNSGYRLMGNYWAEVLKGYLNGDLNQPDTDQPDSVVLGDTDGSGKVNSADLLLMINYLAGKNEYDEKFKDSADINKDGKINITDLVLLKNILV